ncbi:hypothetical protein DFH08DRAFT_899746 [Mycena albidolilacea]|uniref:Uncharacterized protein n=1 Tax=Mycena albidolilacea TaxID=1033008 RepID=A0AAD6Z620_9AGAR|nr:hypothetical protein DFH08DRAFT_899746 [Mycena albidolilacea]
MRGVTGVVEPNSCEHSEVSASPKSHAFRAKIQLGAFTGGSMLVAGWNDGTSGPLIPKMQEVYHVQFLLFSGYISGALINMHWTNRVSFGKVCALCQAAAYAIQVPAPPFPLFVILFALKHSQANTYVASLEHNSEIYMGMVHASYESLARIGEAVPATNSSDHSNFRQILSIKTVHVLAFFILVYVGVEVTIGGWITTYIIDVCSGGASARYISSGFFGGIMVGRLALLWLNKKIGEYRALFLYIALAIGLELVVWFVPSLIGGAVAVALTGVFLGPIVVGNAILPFITGAIASKTGIRALQPLCVGSVFILSILILTFS